MSTAANDASDGVPATAPDSTAPGSGRTARSPSGSDDALSDELAALEERVDRLAALCATLALENRSLRGQQRTLVEERARLIEKNETARSKVEQMIVRLKSLEGGQ